MAVFAAPFPFPCPVQKCPLPRPAFSRHPPFGAIPSARGKGGEGGDSPPHSPSFFQEGITLPPLPEQHAIATTLRTVQEAKEKNRCGDLAATKALKAAMMKHLFTYGPVPLEDAGKVALKETEIGPVPEVWEIRQLSSLFDIEHGYSFKSEFFGSTGTFILLTPGHFNLNRNKSQTYISQ